MTKTVSYARNMLEGDIPIEQIEHLRNQLHTNYQNNIEHEKDFNLH